MHAAGPRPLKFTRKRNAAALGWDYRVARITQATAAAAATFAVADACLALCHACDYGAPYQNDLHQTLCCGAQGGSVPLAMTGGTIPMMRGLGPAGPPLLLLDRASSMGFHAGISLCWSERAGEAMPRSLSAFSAAAAACSSGWPAAGASSGCLLSADTRLEESSVHLRAA